MSPPQIALIAHRDLSVRLHITYCLQLCYPAMRVVEAVDGLTTYNMARLDAPDVAFIDTALPHFSGWDCARYLRQTLPTCRIILLMENAQPFDVMARGLAGIDGSIEARDHKGLLQYVAAIGDSHGACARQVA